MGILELFYNWKIFHKTTLALPLCDALWHFLLSFVKKINPLNWFHDSFVGYLYSVKSMVLCVAEEIAGVDGKERHFGLHRSIFSSCLYRRVEIMVVFRRNFQLFCTGFHSLHLAVCQVLGYNHFCSNTVSKMSGHFSKSLWQLKQWNNKSTGWWKPENT